MEIIYYTEDVDRSDEVATIDRKKFVDVYERGPGNTFKLLYSCRAPFTFTAEEMIKNELAERGIFNTKFQLKLVPRSFL